MSMRKPLVKSTRNISFPQIFYILLVLVASSQPDLFLPMCLALTASKKCSNENQQFKFCYTKTADASALKHTLFAKDEKGYLNLSEGSLLVHKIPLLQKDEKCVAIPSAQLSKIICGLKTILAEKHVLYIGEEHSDPLGTDNPAGRTLLKTLVRKMPEDTIVFSENQQGVLDFPVITLDNQSSYFTLYNRIAYILPYIIFSRPSIGDNTETVIQNHLGLILYYSKNDIWSQLNSLPILLDQQKHFSSRIKDARSKMKSHSEMLNYVKQDLFPHITQNRSMRISFFHFLVRLLYVVEPKLESLSVPANQNELLNLITNLKGAVTKYMAKMSEGDLTQNDHNLFEQTVLNFVSESRNMLWGEHIHGYVKNQIEEKGKASNIIVQLGDAHIKGMKDILAPVAELIDQSQKVMPQRNEL